MTEGVSIITNSISNPSDLTIMEKHFKSIEGTNNSKILASRLFQSKFYLKITGIPYISPNSNKLSSKEISDFMSHTKLFENISLVAKSRIIKAFPKSNMAII